ncbi:MAG: hypothetical protein P4L20_10555 [Acidimicrobiales bacterium]|nr:hypothetical protein [Acidimicrobiales bacterium]
MVLNDAMTSASLSPTNPGSGQSFSVTGYQTVVNLPQSLASAAAAVQPTLAGSATAQIDASGATPATTSEGPLDFSVPIPSPVPAAGVTLSLPTAPATVSGFSATGGPVTIKEDSSASLTLTISGSPLTLTCTAYPNDTVTPSGITTTTPSASPISPVIAVAAGSSTTTSMSSASTSTSSAAPTTLTTSLSGGGQSGTTLALSPGTAVTDQATLSGANAASAGGTVTYRVFSLSFSSYHFSHAFSSWYGWGWQPASSPDQVSVTNGSVPASSPVTLGTGVYFWRVSYSGDANNRPARTEQGAETEIVLPDYCPTGLSWLSVKCFSHAQGYGGNGNGNGGHGYGNGQSSGDGGHSYGNGNGNGNGQSSGDNGHSYGNGNGNGNGNGSGDGGHSYGNGGGNGSGDSGQHDYHWGNGGMMGWIGH